MTLTIEDKDIQEAREGFRDNRFRLIGAVCEEAVNDLMIDLMAWEKLNRGLLTPFTLEIYSHGGNCNAGIALHDYLRRVANQGHHLTTEAYGACGSMGGIIFQAGDTRLVGWHTEIMVHGPSSDVTGTMKEIQDKADSLCRQAKTNAEILGARNTAGLDSAYWLDLMHMGENFYYKGQKAVGCGLADGVIG